ncbi:DASS family sodium-coupled anion symporter [Lentibacillus sp. CBA3610]|uniref:SLC13 family permease n=1 Tax=Lentibacillus sp. CBA3610 TaxID=2518176 RepID=UPI00159624F4|nr:DASS family sodium-coupled anion symporter [Lentibacillus sp. CBA3610]QKY68303.1 DASS family sodium-coupled anion symporter [Lentibacillus sp. CBA3610]
MSDVSQKESVYTGEKTNYSNKRRWLRQKKQIIGIVGAVAAFLSVYYGLPGSFDVDSRKMVAIVTGCLVLWVTETIPIGLTAVLVLLLMLLLNPVSVEVVYSGFASPAVFLIIGGMMLAQAVNETRLAQRITYLILSRWGGNAKGLLGSVLVIPQVQAFFIPATAVRTSLLLPIAINVLDTVGAKRDSPLRKMILLAVAYGCTISGTAVMTAAIGNILAVDILNQILQVNITYFEWFIYSLPLWLALIPGSWFLLLKSFPLGERESSFPHLKQEMQQKIKQFGPLDNKEIKCLVILSFTVMMWMSEPLHGLHPSIPALIGVFLMTFPGIGCADWASVVKINFNTVLLLGATLSMGYALNDSGAAEQIGEVLGDASWILYLMQEPLLALIFVLVATQVIHLLISNVSTAVVTLIPIYIGLSIEAGVNPVLIAYTAAITCLHGYILIVETMTNMIVYSSGQISQRDYLKPGVYMTLLMIGLTILIGLTWWRWLGLVS